MTMATMSDAAALTLDVRDDGILLMLRVSPKAGSDRIGGVHNGALKVAVTAPPDKGRANDAVIRLLAKALGVPPSGIELVSGATSRDKKVRLPAGVSAAARMQMQAEAGAPCRSRLLRQHRFVSVPSRGAPTSTRCRRRPARR